MSAAKSWEVELARDIAGFWHDPLGYVLYAFPWGRDALEGQDGPDEWQRDQLQFVAEALVQGESVGSVIQSAVSSGHGVGKSALVAWLILWALSTFEDTRGVVTANTDTQLRTKTWAELAKWYQLAMNKHWFRLTATSIFSSNSRREKTWRVDAIPWSVEKPESFAGLHNKGRRILVIFDEASAIPDQIWEVTEGALTDAETEIIWCAFGNPTRNSGRFHKAFHGLRHRWRAIKVDSRKTKQANKDQIARWVEDYGEDSDFVRIRVRGEFPRAGSTAFIGVDVIEQAAGKVLEPQAYRHFKPILGVDVARFGDDQTILTLRRGPKVEEVRKYRGKSVVEVSGLVLDWAQKISDLQSICVDGIGIGAGVVDLLKSHSLPVVDVNVGLPARDDRQYANLRAELYGAVKAWLPTAAIPRDDELISDLTNVEYGFNAKLQIQLEKKADMKKRGLGSPDNADSLALTFAETVTGAIPKNTAARPVVAARWR